MCKPLHKIKYGWTVAAQLLLFCFILLLCIHVVRYCLLNRRRCCHVIMLASVYWQMLHTLVCNFVLLADFVLKRIQTELFLCGPEDFELM